MKILYILFLGFVVVSLLWFGRIIKAYTWLRKNRRKTIKHSSNRKLYVFIPVLDEIDRIEETVKYFVETFKHLKKECLILVTTEREYEINDKLENTIIIAKKLEKEFEEVKVYHYPKRDGKMSHQLNYAMEETIKEGIGVDDFFVVYNADSRPEKETFDWVLDMADKRKIRVFQQYGDYLKNIKNLKGVISKKILISAALWQTRWSIGFEISNALKQLKIKQKKNNKSLNYPLNYCIGHGLFFTKDIFLKLGGFNEKMHNEDLIFGLELSYLRELIMPVPYFDESDTPDSVRSLYLQKASWFFGPLQAFQYYRYILNNNNYKLYLFILSTKLFFVRCLLGFGTNFFCCFIDIRDSE